MTSPSKPANRREVWIGLVTVVPRPGWALGGAPEGFVNVVALAADQAEYESRVREALLEAGLEYTNVEDLEPLAHRKAKWTISADLADALRGVSPANPVQFGSFHVYKADRDPRE